MDRTEALAWLGSTGVNTLATKLGRPVADTTAGFTAALDASLAALGVAEADWPTYDTPTADAEKLRALLRYHALVLLQEDAASKEDVVLTGTLGTSRNQVFRAITTMLERAEAALTALGIAPYGGSGLSYGHLTLDFLEPFPTTGVA